MEQIKRKIIIDCDPGIDDSLAIMLALSIEEIEVVGISIVCGNSPVELGYENAKRILKYMNRLDIPIYKGAEKPLKREYINALDTHGEDGLGGSHLPEVKGFGQKKTALEFLSETLIKGGCSVIAIGPMTNLAHLIQKSPEAFAKIEELISMGGCFKSHGNCSPVAEYNYWVDPDAASLVYQHAQAIGKKIHMVGLDVTRKIEFTPNLLEYMKRLDPEKGRFVEQITKFYFDFHWEQEHLIGCVINDPLAVAYFIDRSICRGFEAYTDIAVDGIAIGQSVVDEKNFYQKPANSIVLTETDPKAFFYLFFGKILGKTKEELDLLEKM